MCAKINTRENFYTVQIDIDPAVSSTEYDFTIEEEEKLDSDTDSDSEWEETDDRNAFDIFDAWTETISLYSDVMFVLSCLFSKEANHSNPESFSFKYAISSAFLFNKI